MSDQPAMVSGRLRLFYGIGSVAEGTAFSVFLLFFYNQVLGLPGSLAGLAGRPPGAARPAWLARCDRLRLDLDRCVLGILCCISWPTRRI